MCTPDNHGKKISQKMMFPSKLKRHNACLKPKSLSSPPSSAALLFTNNDDNMVDGEVVNNEIDTINFDKRVIRVMMMSFEKYDRNSVCCCFTTEFGCLLASILFGKDFSSLVSYKI